ncbi:MAG: glycosyltransferase family 39 protein [Oscillospiraceae bacterium]
MACKRALKAVDVLVATFLVAVIAICLPSAGRSTLLFALLGFGVLACAAYTVSRASEKVLDITFAALLCLYAVFVFVVACQLKLEPSWDFGRVYNGAKEIIINNSLEYTYNYFLESHNNFFVALYIARFVQMCGSIFTLSVLDGGIYLNVISIVLSVLFIYLAARVSLGARTAFITGVLCFGFAPLLSYSPIFYTDTLSLPYVSLSLWLIALGIKKERGLLKTLLLGTVTGLVVFVGFKLKATAAFTLVAACVVCLLGERRQKVWKYLAASVVTCSVLFVVYASWISNTTLIEYKNLDQYRLPPMHYVLMGLRGIGGYNGADHQAAQALPDADTRTRVAKEKIAAQLEEYGFSGMRDHMVQKIRFTWNAGLFYSDQKLAQNKAMYTTAQSYASPEGLNFPQYHAYAQSFHWLMLLTIMTSAVKAVFDRRREEVVDIARVAIFGIVLLLLVWETRSRYLVNFIPLFALCEAEFVCSVFRKKNTSRRIRGEHA